MKPSESPGVPEVQDEVCSECKKKRVYGSWRGSDHEGESFGIYASGTESDALAHFFREWLNEMATTEQVAALAREQGIKVELEEEA